MNTPSGVGQEMVVGAQRFDRSRRRAHGALSLAAPRRRQEFIARRHLENVEVCPGRMVSTAEEVEFAAPVTDVEDHSCGAGIVGPLTRMSHVLRLASG